MNSIVTIGLGFIVGGVLTSIYYGRKINIMISKMLDIKTVNSLLKEHTVKQDEKEKSKNKNNYKSTKRRKSSGDKSTSKS